MGCTPSASCCCCVPLCCGLRGGIISLAVLQMIGGLFYVGVFVISIIEIAALASGYNVTTASTPWFSVILLTILYVITAATFIITSVVGIQASSDVDKITRLDPYILQKASMYWNINRIIFIYYTISVVVGAILNTVFFYRQLTTEEANFAAAFYWAVVLVLIGIFSYFLYVIWSYKAILFQARSGELDGPFVVRGTHFAKRSAEPTPGAPPAVAKV